MNCKYCGIRIPERCLTMESFHCPKCGHRYIRKPQAHTKSHPPKRSRVSISKKKITTVNRKAVFLLAMLLVICVIFAVIILVSDRKAGSDVVIPTAQTFPAATEMPAEIQNSIPMTTETTAVITNEALLPEQASNLELLSGAEEFSAWDETEALNALSGIEEFSSSEILSDLEIFPVEETDFEPDLNSPVSPDHDESTFLGLYSDWFGSLETQYVFVGTIDTSSVTDKELPSAQLHSYQVIYNDDGWTLPYFVPIDGEGNELPFVYTLEADQMYLVYPEEYAADIESAENVSSEPEIRSYSDISADEYIACGKDLLLKYMHPSLTIIWDRAVINDVDGYGRALVNLNCRYNNVSVVDSYLVCVVMNPDGSYSYNTDFPLIIVSNVDPNTLNQSILTIRKLNAWGSPR